MYREYLLTGATGFLGNTIAWMLHEKGYHCKALVMPDDPYVSKLPADTEFFSGDLLDLSSLDTFFREASGNSCVIHCAGIVSIASRPNPLIFKVNVEGTQNMLRLAAAHQVGRFIHVSSIHAIPDRPKGEIITEVSSFDEALVKGEYAKSKAIASQLALQAAHGGLNLSVVHPSGIIGPGDWRHGQITSTILSYCNGKLPAAVQGGNNFVDVRDVADGILSCADNGAAGECYILSGHTVSIKTILEQVRNIIDGKKLVYLPLWLVTAVAPMYEKIAISHHENPYLTPYSAYALGANSEYSHEKAANTFDFSPRRIEDTIEDTIRWLLKTGQIVIE